MMRLALAILLLLAAAPAEAKARVPHWAGPRYYAVWAQACDPVSRRCTPAVRYFRNPVWR